MTHDTDRKDEGLDPFETWFASMSRADQQTYLPHSYAMRKAWNEALRRVSSVGGGGPHAPNCNISEKLSAVCSCRHTPDTSGEGELRQRVAWFERLFKFDEDDGAKMAPNDPITKDAVVIPRTYFDSLLSRSRPSAQPQANGGVVEITFFTGIPDVKSGDLETFIVVTESDKGYRSTLPAYYLNAYPLEHDDCICPSENEHKEDGCPVSGWHYDESNFEYDNCYHPIRAKVLAWARLPSADAALRSPSTPSVQEAEVAGEELRATLIETFRASMIDEVKDLANPHFGTKHPDILEAGCRAIGYINPKDAAEKTAAIVVDAMLAAMSRLRSPRQTEVNAKLLSAFRKWWREDCRFGMTESDALSSFQEAIAAADTPSVQVTE